MAEHVKGITARTLFKNSNREIIKNIIQDQIRIIDAKIQVAHSSGFDSITHELPINFIINNMSKSDAQLLIYSELITTYKNPEPDGKGFRDVHIDLGSKPMLYIKWINGMDDEERRRRYKIITRCAMPHG